MRARLRMPAATPTTRRLRRACRVAGTLVLVVAGMTLGACDDGANLFTGELGPAKVIPKIEAEPTSPVTLFDTNGTPFPTPTGGFGAAGPGGFALVATDDGEDLFQQSVLEESDAVVSDPDNNRVVLLKARAHSIGQAPEAIDLAGLNTPRGLKVAEAANTRRVIVATATGYSVLRIDGAIIGNHVVAGAPCEQLEVALDDTRLFVLLSSGSTVVRQEVTNDGGFEPFGAPTLLLEVSPATIRGLSIGANQFLFFTADSQLRRLAESLADTVSSTNAVIDDVFTFAVGEVPGGIVQNSEGNSLVAIDDGGGGGRVDEISVGGALVAQIPLSTPAREVTVDGFHAAVFWLSAGGARVRIEVSPDLDDRLVPIFARRQCIGCHPVVFPALDLTSAENAHRTLAGADAQVDCNGTGAPGGKRVNAGSADSLLIQKLTNPPGSCSVRMPQGNRPIPAVEIDQIRQWILSGANP